MQTTKKIEKMKDNKPKEKKMREFCEQQRTKIKREAKTKKIIEIYEQKENCK